MLGDFSNNIGGSFGGFGGGMNSFGSGFGGGFNGGYTGNVDFTNSSGPSVLGNLIDLSPALAPVVQGFQSYLNAGGSIYAKKFITKNGEKFAARFLDDAAHQRTAASVAANVAEKTLLLYDPAIGFVMNVRNHHKENLALARDLGSYLEAHHYKANTIGLHQAAKHNQVLADALAATNEKARGQLTAIGLSAAMAIPNIIINNKDMKMGEASQAMEAKVDEFNRLERNVYERDPDTLAKLRGEAAEMLRLGKLRPQNDIEPEQLLLNHKGRQLDEERSALKREQDAKAQSLQNYRYQYLPIATGVASAVTQPLLDKSQKGDNKSDVLAMIGHLREQVRADPNGDTIEVKEGEPVKIADFVHQIFLAHQTTHHEQPIGKHSKAQFDDACEEISKAILERRLDPMSLIDLVGERQIVKHGGKVVAGNKEVKRLIAEAEKLIPVQAVDLSTYEDNAILSLHDNKAILSGLKGADRAFFIATKPPEEMKKAGVKIEEIQKANDAAHGDFNEKIAKAVRFIAAANDNRLHDEGYDKEDIQALREAERAVNQGGVGAIESRISAPGQGGLVDLVADNKRLWKSIDRAMEAPLPEAAAHRHRPTPRIAANDDDQNQYHGAGIPGQDRAESVASAR